MLDARATQYHDKPMPVEGFSAATLNGWGYPSVSHILPTPHFELFRKVLPAIPEAEFNQIFNRYSNIILTREDKPRLIDSFAIGVPITAFGFPRLARVGLSAPLPSKVLGDINIVEHKGNKIKITGWAPWKGEYPSQSLHLVIDSDVRNVHLSTLSRSDVTTKLGVIDYLWSGFILEFTLLSSNDITLGEPDFCLVATGTAINQDVVLNNISDPQSCEKSVKSAKKRNLSLGDKRGGSST